MSDAASRSNVRPTALDYARDYIRRGWSPTPIAKGTKRPRTPGWQRLRISEADAPRYFGADCNIGIILGEASSGLIDLDLDCAEAIEFAPNFQMATDAIFGRKSNPHSHRLYYVEGTAPTLKFEDPVSGDTLLELRGDGGLQTVFPGSIHPSGEPIEWEADGIPATVDAALLCKHAKALAASCLLKRYCPGVTDYQSMLLALGRVDRRVADRARGWLGILPANPIGPFTSAAEGQGLGAGLQPPARRRSISETLRRSLNETAWSPAEEARVRSAVRVIPAASRDVWLRVGMALHATEWANAFELWHEWSRTCPEKYNEADQQRTWDSFGRRRGGASITLRTVFHLAMELGWSEDHVTDANSSGHENDQPNDSLKDQNKDATQRRRELMMSAAELRTMRFDPVRYVLPDFVPEGITLIAGRPKIGKSWLALDLAVACAANGSLLGTLTPLPGDVLYLALEDGWRRLQRRLDKLLGTFRGEWPERLTLVAMGGWPRADEGGLAKMEEWCKSVAKPVLVIIDTLVRFRKPSSGKSPLYSDDYEAITGLQKIATDYGIGIIVLHHDRKADADDAFDTVSGTLGLTGAADTILIIKRHGSGVVLYARGRDIEESETAIQFDKEHCRWTILGKASEVQRSAERARVIGAIKAAGRPLSITEIMSEAEMPTRNAVDILLSKMVKEGKIIRVKRGWYDLSSAGNGQKERLDGQVIESIDKTSDLSDLSDLSERPRKCE
jgi:hypothetical protein